MNSSRSIDILNELLALERDAQPARLSGATTFVSRASLDVANLVRLMEAQNQEHAAWLTEAILRLGGAPGFGSPSPTAAEMNYVAMGSIVPKLLSEQDILIGRYRAAVAHLTGEPQAAALALRILERHESQLAKLQKCETAHSLVSM